MSVYDDRDLDGYSRRPRRMWLRCADVGCALFVYLMVVAFMSILVGAVILLKNALT